MAVSVSLHLYRVENIPDGTNGGVGTFRISGVFPQDVEVRNIKRVNPVNALLGADLFGAATAFLYGKITFENPGFMQEAYTMQSIAQLHTLINA